MRVPYPVPGLTFSPFLYFLSLSLAQDTPETIFKLDVFTEQKPCAQSCFTYFGGGCNGDALGGFIGCQFNDCTNDFGSPDRCYCRLDLQSVAQSYLTSC